MAVVPPDGDPGAPFRSGGCSPGFTGQFCENGMGKWCSYLLLGYACSEHEFSALCSSKGSLTPINCNVGFGCVIDRDVEAICSASQSISVDSHITRLYVVIDSSAASWPKINLINPSGKYLFNQDNIKNKIAARKVFSNSHLRSDFFSECNWCKPMSEENMSTVTDVSCRRAQVCSGRCPAMTFSSLVGLQLVAILKKNRPNWEFEKHCVS